jgi:chaperonin cofactor prefoldin
LISEHRSIATMVGYNKIKNLEEYHRKVDKQIQHLHEKLYAMAEDRAQ